MVLEQICSVKEPDLLFLLQSVLKLTGKATGQYKIWEWLKRERRERLGNTKGRRKLGKQQQQQQQWQQNFSNIYNGSKNYTQNNCNNHDINNRWIPVCCACVRLCISCVLCVCVCVWRFEGWMWLVVDMGSRNNTPPTPRRSRPQSITRHPTAPQNNRPTTT